MAQTTKNDGPSESFIREMTGCQGRLYAYILTLLPDIDAANDILQETNLTIWRKWNEFTEGTSFHAWVCRIAYFAVLAYRRNSARDRHLFDEQLIGEIARAAAESTGDDGRLLALQRCLSQLKSTQRELIQSRYTRRISIDALADALGTTAQAIVSRLYRIRQILQDCVARAGITQ